MSENNIPKEETEIVFSLLNWNVWFDSLQFSTRVEHIFAECEKLMPNIICFQEVTVRFVKMLFMKSAGLAWFHEYYECSNYVYLNYLVSIAKGAESGMEFLLL